MQHPDELIFAREETGEGRPGHSPGASAPWKVLIVDDEAEVHRVTRLVLSGFSYQDRPLQFLSAYSGGEARRVLAENQDIAVILLDVVMEELDSGLALVRYIRHELQNRFVRIILRTGQPGQAPEAKVIVQYDINDYKEKTELTAQKLITAMVSALRTFIDMQTIEAWRQGLAKILDASADVFRLGSMERFASAVLSQLLSLLGLKSGALFCQVPGCSGSESPPELTINAASGTYEHLLNAKVQDLPDTDMRRCITEALLEHKAVCRDRCHVEYFESKTGSRSLIYFEEYRPLSDLDRKLVEIFFANVSIGFDNLSLNQAAEQKTLVAQRAQVEAERAGREVIRQTAQRVESLQKISKAVAHQLRNPMTVIAGFANLLRRNPQISERYGEYLDGIVASAARIESIISAVNEYNGIRVGEKTAASVPGIIRRLESWARAKAADMGVSTSLTVQAEALEVLADEPLLTRALQEIVTNALEAVESGRGEIAISAELAGDRLRLAVRDNGRGIPEDELAYVLDPFYTTKAVGVGMGLTRASRIVQEHGGSLSIQSSPGFGTKVEIFLP